MSGAHLSKDFFELIKNIGECKSKQEEEKIVSNEIAALRQRLSEAPATIGLKKSKEAIVRVMYVEMLGQPAEFGHIHAINMTQQTNLLCKRVGYLACSLCLHPEHELITLLVNTMRRDLKSTNHLEVCAALIAVSKLVNAEIMPAIIECVAELLDHTHEVVRKKAVMTLHRLHVVVPGALDSLTDKLRRVLCDKDPAVMGASLHALHALIVEAPGAFKDLVPSFVSILKQITEHRLPNSFDYHRMPAPWIQIKLLKVLASLGVADQRLSEHMYEILNDVLKRADTGINIGYAVVYECVRTITAIYPNVQLMETAANHISRFVASENHNLKYLGIKSLASIVQVNQKYALEHQLVVVDCMEDSDETLKRKTLDLLFKMTNANNVTFVVDKLVLQLRQTGDAHFKTELVERITQLAERYAPDNAWFITTMNHVFELGGDVVQPDTAHNLLRLIAEGGGEDDDADAELRLHAVRAYSQLLQRPHIPDVLCKVVCWTLGEYGYLSDEIGLEALVEVLCDVMERQFAEPDTRCWVMAAITKLSAQLPAVPDQALEIARRYAASKSVVLQQYCDEFLALAREHGAMAAVLPVDSSCDDLEVDASLGFLDKLVDAAVRAGGRRYLKPAERPDELRLGGGGGGGGGGGAGPTPVAGAAGGLRFNEYANPMDSLRAMANADMSAMAVGGAGAGGAAGWAGGGGGGGGGAGGLNTAGVARRWGAEGYAEGSGGAPPVASAPPPPPPPTSLSAAAPPSFGAASNGGGGGGLGGLGAAVVKTAAQIEKERMAAALFSGMGAGGTARAAAVTAASPPPAPAAAPRPLAPSPAAAQPAAAAAAAAAVGAARGKGASSGGKEGKASSKKKAAAAADDAAHAHGAANGSVGDLLGDLLDLDLTAGPGAAALPLAASNAQQPMGIGQTGGGLAGLDLLDLATPSLPPLAPTAAAPLQPALFAASAPPRAPQPAHANGAHAAAAVPLAADGCLEISARLSYGSDAVTYELSYASRTHSPLRNVTLNLEPPAQLRLALGKLAGGAGCEVRGNRLVIALIHGGQTVAHTADLVCCDLPTPQMRVAGFVSYMEDVLGSLETRTLSFQLNLSLEQLLRPHAISTAQFGQLWSAHAAQRKFVVATKSIAQPQAYMQVMESQLRFHPVQVIGVECIACATVLGIDATVLVHAKVGLNNGTAVDVTVRTRDNRLGEGVQRICTQVLAS